MWGWCGRVGERVGVFFVVDRCSWCVGCIARICCFGRGVPGVCGVLGVEKWGNGTCLFGFIPPFFLVWSR